jgi:ribosome-binding factor A
MEDGTAMEDQHGQRRRSRGVPADDAGAAGYRHARLQEIIGAELALLLRNEVADPLLDDVRLTQCELSVDYSSVRAWFTVAGSPSREQRRLVEAALERASGFLRGRLAAAIDIKQTPRLRFTYDEVAMSGPPGAER